MANDPISYARTTQVRLRRGTTAQIAANPPIEAEPFYDLTEKRIGVGGTTEIIEQWKSQFLEHTADATDAVPRNLQEKLTETVSVKDFGAVGDGSDEYAIIKKAWDFCVANGKSLYFPAGVYSSGSQNMPFKNPEFPASSLLDCKNIVIHGEGPNTILMSESSAGADVINVYECKNLHFRSLKIKATLSGSSGAGSNAVSVVGGFDNITFENIWAEDLPYVDKTTYLDGGKGFTIQTGTPSTEVGTLVVKNFFVKGCVYGFGVEVDLPNFATKRHAIDIHGVAEDCYVGFLFSAGESGASLSTSMTMGLTMKGIAVNCQRSALIGRAHGMVMDVNIVTTKTASQRRLNPSGGSWSSSDSTVDGLFCAYAKNSIISTYGDIGECDYKVQVGGTTAGSSGLSGETESCKIYIDIGGLASTAVFNLLNSGGNTISDCLIFITSLTGLNFSTLPSGLFATSKSNTVTVGPESRLPNPMIMDELKFAYTDGVASYSKFVREDFGIYAQQTGGSSTNLLVGGYKKNDGSTLFAVRNDGSILSDGRNSASSVSTVIQVMPIYDSTNSLVGYLPIYQSYT